MAEPRRAVRPVAAWLAAAVAAVAVASWGVALVGRSVTDERPAPLSAAQVEERLALAAPSTSTTAAGDPVPTTGTTVVAPSAPGPTVVGPSGGSSGEPDPSGPAPGPGPTATTVAPPPATTVAPAPAGETRTYQLVGGTVSLRFAPTGVTVVFANPNQGFEVDQEPEGGGVRVELESDSHRSRVTGWWDGGPRDRVDEQPDIDGGDDGDD